jgi:HTH-type transcriptional regulator/antitoxin HigA
MEIRPIKTEEDYRTTLLEIETLMDAVPSSNEEDKLDVLATLVQVYESNHYPVLPPDPIEAILYRMACQGLSRKDLEKYIGSRSRVYEVLNRKRPLSLEMIRTVNIHLGIPADTLVRPYPTQMSPTGTRKLRGNKGMKKNAVTA